MALMRSFVAQMPFLKSFIPSLLALALLLGSSGCRNCFNCECPVVIIVNGQETPGGSKEIETCDVDEQRSLELDEGCDCEQL